MYVYILYILYIYKYYLCIFIHYIDVYTLYRYICIIYIHIYIIYISYIHTFAHDIIHREIIGKKKRTEMDMYSQLDMIVGYV